MSTVITDVNGLIWDRSISGQLRMTASPDRDGSPMNDEVKDSGKLKLGVPDTTAQNLDCKASP
ncbi:hypothetical protein [Streptomyces sp. NPDC001635]